MPSSTMPRNERRRSWSESVRIEAAEQDLDTFDDQFVSLNNKIDRLTARATGLLIALTSSAILLAINLVMGR